MGPKQVTLTLKVGVQATLELFGCSTMGTFKEVEKRLKRKVLALWRVAYVSSLSTHAHWECQGRREGAKAETDI